MSEHNNIRKITNVKNIIMEHLESVIEGTEKAQELIDSNIGSVLDAENEQDNEDCAVEGITEHVDFTFKDPNEFHEAETTTSDNTYKKIEIYGKEKLDHLTRNMDEDQRLVLDKVVDFAIKIKLNQSNIYDDIEIYYTHRDRRYRVEITRKC